MRENPIAVFDSGLGGLSVVRHLRRLMPDENIVYFGDTARVPYGTKSARTVATFALESARFLLSFEPKLVVAACNTASALALDDLERELPTPVLGVVIPGAAAAVRAAAGRPIGVLGTEATIRSGAYERAISELRPETRVIAQACPLFVPLVEEGRSADDPIVRAVATEYLRPVREQNVGVVVLGCTHYPMLRDAVEREMGPGVAIIDSGEETSRVARQTLVEMDALAIDSPPASLRCFVSDNPGRFRGVGSRFLQEEIEQIEFVPPERYIATAEETPPR
ncbi:MAG: glutamate racemase [Phycisphaerae bacterium]